MVQTTNGEMTSQEIFGSGEEQSDGQDVAATSDGGVVVAGAFIEKKSQRIGTRVLKFDAANRPEWDQRFDTGIAFAIRQTRDGGYILSGARNIPDTLNSNPFVLRLDAEGNKLWERIYADFEIYVLLDSGVVETETCDYILVFKSVAMRIDNSGRIIWVHRSGDLNLGTVTVLSGNRPVVGGSLVVNNFDHAYVAALDEEGRGIIWDNIEISFPSGVTQIIPNNEGLITATGYIPLNMNQSQMFFAVYRPERLLEG